MILYVREKGVMRKKRQTKPPLEGEGAIAGDVTLTKRQWKTFKELGNGNRSRGIRRSLTTLSKAKLAIELLLTKHDKAEEFAEAILLELEDLEIEQLYKDAIIDGDIEPKSGAWIM